MTERWYIDTLEPLESKRKDRSRVMDYTYFYYTNFLEDKDFPRVTIVPIAPWFNSVCLRNNMNVYIINLLSNYLYKE